MSATAHIFSGAPNYAAVVFPAPRDFQTSAHEKLREGFREGHRRQLLVAPTGSGKTYLGLRIIHEALLKGRRALFVCDRTALINQTSERADNYGLNAHGIVQANHWRRDTHMPFQIASIQTIQARGYWPEADVIVIDEAHTQYKATKEKLAAGDATIVGLTATPCSQGLGLSYTNMVNAATMHELTQVGVLVPMRILSCVTPDMAGAETSGGEWTAKAASQREAQIIGDVVSEWIQHGENRKTIAFGADIAYCKQLAQRFNEAGIVADVFTSETKDDERAVILKEFRKEDSKIRILVSVEALAKGFDVEDIGCVIDARPLRKSLSTAIQMWGRGLRSSLDTGKADCLVRGTLVLTDCGEVPIEHVTLDHKVWDGENFVSHAGAVCRGVREVIEYDGLIATPDHRVMTNDGWTRLEEAARRQLRIARTGIDGCEVRFSHNQFANRSGQRLRSSGRSAMRALWSAALRALSQHQEAAGHRRMPALQWTASGAGSGVALSPLSVAVESVPKPKRCGLRAVRWARDRISVFVGQRGGALGGVVPRRTGSVNAVGSQEQRWPLPTGKSAVDLRSGQSEQHARFWGQSALHRLSAGISWHPLRRCDARQVALEADARGNRGALERTLAQAKREVWDVLSAGPLQRFTANGRLVHNCLLLDHSGNIQRFLKDFTEIYFDGFTSLDMSEKLDKIIRKDAGDGEPMGCPQCGFKPFYRRCMSCGHEKQTLALVGEAAGEMREIRIGKNVIAADKQDLWNQLCTYARQHVNNDPSKKAGWAWYKFQDITGERPPRAWRFDDAPDVPVTRGTLNKLKSLRIAYHKAREARPPA